MSYTELRGTAVPFGKYLLTAMASVGSWPGHGGTNTCAYQERFIGIGVDGVGRGRESIETILQPMTVGN